jgi:hypothetical protein
MPIRIVKEVIRSTTEIVRSALSLLEGKMPKVEYAHVKRLLYDGSRRDLIFIHGITTGLQLAALPKKKAETLIQLLKAGIENEGKKRVLFDKKELAEIDALLKGSFNLSARRHIINTLERSDVVLLQGLISTLEKLYGF